ncbi:hypothetical protein E2C01_038308 [Portunus trituberculatus]|uniref:Uncharacterized protein n=1 Tax=Portunus trituberculatus TaxID=210409 RepID=A0A5B7FBW7_PORTR|nr:hypothetical protein [Portunus trituberculatus]
MDAYIRQKHHLERWCSQQPESNLIATSLPSLQAFMDAISRQEVALTLLKNLGSSSCSSRASFAVCQHRVQTEPLQSAYNSPRWPQNILHFFLHVGTQLFFESVKKTKTNIQSINLRFKFNLVLKNCFVFFLRQTNPISCSREPENASDITITLTTTIATTTTKNTILYQITFTAETIKITITTYISYILHNLDYENHHSTTIAEKEENSVLCNKPSLAKAQCFT